jgi:hypothetical protein
MNTGQRAIGRYWPNEKSPAEIMIEDIKVSLRGEEKIGIAGGWYE